MFPAAESTIGRLDDARQRWWVFSLLCGLVLSGAFSVAALAVAVLADVFLQLPLGWLRVLLMAWGGSTAIVLVATVYRLLRHPRSREAAARRVELCFPELGSHLINLIQLASTPSGDADPFQRAAIAEASARVERVPFHLAANKHTRWWRWRLGLHTPRDLAEACAALGLVVGLVALMGMAVPRWSSSLERLCTPWRFVPQVGVVNIVEVTPGDTTIRAGSPVRITATIADPGDLQPGAILLVTPSGGQQSARNMNADVAGTVFAATLSAVVAPLRYRLRIGDSQSDVYHVGVRNAPIIEDVEVGYEYPAYLTRQGRHATDGPETRAPGSRVLPPDMPVRADQQVTQKHADLEAPQYTTARLKLACSAPLARGHARLPDYKEPGRVRGKDRRTLEFSLRLSKQTSYTIHLFDEFGFTDPAPRVNTIRVVPDSPPTVTLLTPAGDVSAAAGREVPLVVRAGDDHGLDEVRLEWKLAEPVAGQTETPTGTLHRWRPLAGTTATTLKYDWTVDPARAGPGQTVLARAVAVDQRRLTWRGERLEPQWAASPWRAIHVIETAQEATETLARLERLHARLWAVLQRQIGARVATAAVAKTTALAEALAVAGDVRRRQVRVQTTSAELATSIDSHQDQQEGAIKQVLNRLAHGPMLHAAEQAESIAKMKQLGDVKQHVPPLVAVQDKIIDVLRRLLEASRRAKSEVLAAIKERPGGDLPDDVEKKLGELAERLDQFAKQQRRVIEATEALAKRPVDDFGDEQQQQLNALAATEDDWSRFMAEAHSDFSKLPEQDFANPSLLQELVNVQNELQMAADALTNKAVDIAVPLEQLGAEMAEELHSNIEKWLPDTPDRERWSQEEPLTDEMKEAPMAELPGELEDLVGELMEEEEALFDELEDVSSSWADSLDKGAGWDAMDGPISNMSAKGVTGNRLPNSSEIGGRSGEGRQGKSSGEFVGDLAVGKGGRRTPSRLAPDPFVKGPIKDLSKDPVGGATGGGKQSGAGAEGLEGPVPSQAERDLVRLATRQADLRNRAETVNLKFQVLNYHHTDLKRLIEMMAAVERDLRGGRYRSARRHRDVMLDQLRKIKSYVEGEFEIRRDQTSNLPGDIQRELLGGMQEISPSGWEALNREYFRRLSGDEPLPTSDQTAEDGDTEP